MTHTAVLHPDEQWWPIDTPFGRMLLGGSDHSLGHVFLPNSARVVAEQLDPAAEGRPDAVAEAECQVKEYFAGSRQVFDLPLDPHGTLFQRSVWFALGDIGYGKTATYAEIARRVGRPTAYRAVGMTNGRNPLPLVLPCHRVIGSNGTLVGYGGGLELKEQLLAFERGLLEGCP